MILKISTHINFVLKQLLKILNTAYQNTFTIQFETSAILNSFQSYLKHIFFHPQINFFLNNNKIVKAINAMLT